MVSFADCRVSNSQLGRSISIKTSDCEKRNTIRESFTQNNNDAFLFTGVHSFAFSGLRRKILCNLRQKNRDVELTFLTLILRFEVVSGQLRGAVATLTYEDNIDTTGWGQIRVETSERFPDEVQAKAAG